MLQRTARCIENNAGHRDLQADGSTSGRLYGQASFESAPTSTVSLFNFGTHY